jgi:hypothetical protein
LLRGFHLSALALSALRTAANSVLRIQAVLIRHGLPMLEIPPKDA